MSGLEKLAVKAFLYSAKAYISILVSLGGVAINMAGSELGISPPGKKLTNMSFSEIFQNLNSLGSKISDPRMQEEVFKIIKIHTGKVQKAIVLLLSLAQEIATTSTTQLCKMPLISNACAVTELSNDLLNLAITKVNQTAKKSSQFTSQLPSSTSLKFPMQTITVPKPLNSYHTGGAVSDNLHHLMNKKQQIKNRINKTISNFLNVRSNNAKTKKRVKL